MKLLIVSNMGAKPSSPMQGVFVDKQVARLEKNYDTSYHYLKWNGDSFFHKLFKYPLFFIKFIIKFIFSFKSFDVIHIHYYYPTIFAALIYKIFRNSKVKIVVTCHGSDIYSYPKPTYLYKRLTSIVDYWVFTSKKLKSRFYKDVNQSCVISAGFDEEIFKCNQVNNSKKELDFLFVGHLDQNKGIDRLIYLIQKLPQCNFGVIGSGSDSQNLVDLEKQVNNLRVFGSLSQGKIVEQLKHSKFLLSLSRKESFGLVMSEANACAVPCITTETDGSIEQFGDNFLMVKQIGIDEDLVRKDLLDKVNFALDLEFNTYSELCLSSQQNAQRFSLLNSIESLKLVYKTIMSESLKSH